MAVSLSIGIVLAGCAGSVFSNALRTTGHTIVDAHTPFEANLDCLGAVLFGAPSLSAEEIAR